MKILTAITYYHPYVSGLTIYAKRLAEALVEEGHEVQVLCAQHEQTLPRAESIAGVSVTRVPVWARLSKGVLMPTLEWEAAKYIKAHDVLLLHLPQFDAARLAVIARLMRKPIIITYHCDVYLPPGLLNRFAEKALKAMNYGASALADAISTYTDDYADNSPLLSSFRSKVRIIAPPVVLPAKRNELTASTLPPADAAPVIGMAARFSAEKGVEVLLDALDLLRQRFPKLCVLFAGPYKDVPGEEKYRELLFKRISVLEGEGRWRFLGSLGPAEMVSFYNRIDALVVPSLNSTEAFGLVQIEAMFCGKRVVTSSLPGVREPVRRTGYGSLVTPGSVAELAAGITATIEQGGIAEEATNALRAQYAPVNTARNYVKLFTELLG